MNETVIQQNESMEGHLQPYMSSLDRRAAALIEVKPKTTKKRIMVGLHPSNIAPSLNISMPQDDNSPPTYQVQEALVLTLDLQGVSTRASTEYTVTPNVNKDSL